MIVDASVAVKWVIDEDGSDLAKALLNRTDLVAPTLVHAEVGNALWKKQRRGKFSDDIELAILPALFASLIRTIDETPMMARALDLQGSSITRSTIVSIWRSQKRSTVI